MSSASPRPIVAVLDTNVVIAALVWTGTPGKLMARATEGNGIALASSPALINELANTLVLPRFSNRIRESGHSVADLVTSYSQLVRLVDPRDVPRVVPDDLDDDHVIAAALAVGADYIVTGDRAHLLPIGQHQKIAIVTPRQCLDLLGS
jgi:putative PIN family toxin of toxin-antitoxin system